MEPNILLPSDIEKMAVTHFASLCFCLIILQAETAVIDTTKLCQTGKAQSPILIDFSRATFTSYPTFSFSSDYRRWSKFQVFHEKGQGITIRLDPTVPKSLTVTGGCLPGTFTFQSAHLHWPRSEHSFATKSYIAEAQFIHKNLETNQTAVFAYFFTLATDYSADTGYHSNGWTRLLQGLYNTTVTLSDGLTVLMDGHTDRFIHYLGSLTTSPCTEGILWILVSSNIKLFSTNLYSLQENVVASNYRAIQALNSRVLRRSFSSNLWKA